MMESIMDYIISFAHVLIEVAVDFFVQFINDFKRPFVLNLPSFRNNYYDVYSDDEEECVEQDEEMEYVVNGVVNDDISNDETKKVQ